MSTSDPDVRGKERKRSRDEKAAYMYEDLKEELLREIDQRLPSSHSKSAAESLEKAINSVTAANQQLEKRLSLEWRYPQIAMVLVIAFLGVNTLGNFVGQYLSYSELSKQSARLSDQFDKIQTAGNDIKSTKDKLEIASKSMDDFIVASAGAMEAAHSILTAVNLGQEHLVLQHDPQQAIAYAAEAERILREKQDSCKDQPKIVAAMEELWPSIWILSGQSGLMTDDMRTVESAAQKLLGHDCECRDGSYFDAVVKLDASFTDTGNRQALLQDCIRSFKKAIPVKHQEGHHALLLLSAAYLYASQPQTAGETVSTYLRGFPQDDRYLQSPVIISRLKIAKAIARLAAIITRDMKPKSPSSLATCAPENEELSSMAYLPICEGKLLERVMESVIKNRNEYGLPPDTSNLLGLNALDAMLLIRHASCSGPGPSIPNLIKKYELENEDSEGDSDSA